MISGRLALLTGVMFLGLIALQLSGYASDWNTSLYELMSGASNAKDGFLIRRLAVAATQLGDTYFCMALVCLTLFWGWTTHSMTVARGFAVAMFSVGVLNSALKLLVSAVRPESGQWMTSFSFPSGHASAGSAAWTMFAVIAFMGLQRAPAKILTVALLMAIACAVAFSRVLIGVHWPLDVIAGIFEGLMVSAVFYRIVYQKSAKPLVITHDVLLLLGMTAVMSVVYVVL